MRLDSALAGLRRGLLGLASQGWRRGWALLPAPAARLAAAIRVPLALLARRALGTPPRPPRLDRTPPEALQRWRRRHEAWLQGRLPPAPRPGTTPRFLVRIADGEAAPGALAASLASLAAQRHPPTAIRLPGETGKPPEAEWLLVLRPGEVLHPLALALLAEAARAWPAAQILYADEEQAGEGGAIPWLKPDFDADWHLAANLFGPATAWRTALAARWPDAPPEELARRAARAVPAAAIRHLPMLLATAPPRQAGREQEAAAAVLAEAAPDARVSAAPLWPAACRIAWPLPDPAPLVSVLVPTRDRAALLEACLEGVLHRTDYPALEVIVIDNDSREAATAALLARLRQDARVRVLPAPGPFNYAALNNQAAAAARGEVLLLLNNDIEVIGPGWLAELVAQAVRPGVGAVGAKLLYADGSLQHGGVVTGIGGVADHYLPKTPREDPGPFGSLGLVREVTAVTGACLAVRREAFLAVGGFDAARLAVAFNDVDLCLKLRARGLRNLWTPFAELYHLESASRGADLSREKMRRFAGEIATMQDRWGAALMADPFYSPWLSLEGAYAALAPRPQWRDEFAG
ncbi:glycosyltransferase [Siccirubricoccus phaeus]|uniref:glycosyltransferase n=1 Tax=Siccirubricoccus phaeus TaxID=2595053 RepID=UPI001A9C974B|nr:glycosyltransferase [Siccirubricoccus phaeus]